MQPRQTYRAAGQEPQGQGKREKRNNDKGRQHKKPEPEAQG
jgi:hypothetical protein